jgi:hypothetical protein
LIHIVVEIWPNGSQTRRREIARMDIGNISDLATVSSYAVEAKSVPNPLAADPVAFSARGTIDGHRRDEPIWSLLAKAMVWASDLARRS